jgi:hypothetical protein
MNTRPNRATRRRQNGLAEAGHGISLSTRDAVIVFDGLLLVDLWLGKPESRAAAAYGPEHVEALRTRLVTAVPELESYAKAVKP